MLATMQTNNEIRRNGGITTTSNGFSGGCAAGTETHRCCHHGNVDGSAHCAITATAENSHTAHHQQQQQQQQQPAVVNGVTDAVIADDVTLLLTSNVAREFPAVKGSTSTVDGPDRILPADQLWTTSRDQAVLLRMSDTGPSYERPISVVTAFRQIVSRSGDHIALAVKVDGSWKTCTYKQYYDNVWTAAKAFIKLGLEPMNGVGIIGFNSPEWFFSDLGAIFAGGLATGIYTTNSAELCQYIAHSARCNVIVVENETQLKKIRSVWSQLPHLKAVVQYHGQPSTDSSDNSRPVYSWSHFMSLADTVSDELLHERIRQQAVNKCCTLIYTSGTTGHPKGVMLSHDNLLMVAKMSSRHMGMRDGEVIISFLPLSHVAAQVMDIYIPLILATTLYFAKPDALKGSLGETLVEVRPTSFIGVPRVWEKIQEKMREAGAATNGFLKRHVIGWAKNVGLRGNISAMRRDGGSSRPFCSWKLADWLVFRKVRRRLGLDRCRLCTAAAAPVSQDTHEFFMSLDIVLLEIYGMSESTGPHTCSTPQKYRVTGSGTPIDGSSVTIVNKDATGSGEICLNGRNIFMGYLDDVENTRQAIDENGLLHSGDLGRIDEDGILFVTGRLKELLITAGGENVAPIPIEENVKKSLPFISNCMLVGDKRKFIAILLALETEVDPQTMAPTDELSKSTARWLHEEAGASVQTVADVIRLCGDVSSRVRGVIQDGIDRANRSAPSRAQMVHKWAILPRDFSTVGGEIGPTLKMRRPIIAAMYASTIDAFYTENKD